MGPLFKVENPGTFMIHLSLNLPGTQVQIAPARRLRCVLRILIGKPQFALCNVRRMLGEDLILPIGIKHSYFTQCSLYIFLDEVFCFAKISNQLNLTVMGYGLE